MDTSMKPQYSEISEYSSMKGTPEAIRDWLISLQPASPASPSQSLESNKENQIPETSGPKRLSASASYDPDTHSWRTYQASLLTDTFSEFSETWPRAGMIVDGKLFQRLRWEHRINEIGSGYWPTPIKGDWKGQIRKDGTAGMLSGVVKLWPTPRVKGQEGYDTRTKRKGHDIAMSYLESAVEFKRKRPTPTKSESIDVVRDVFYRGKSPRIKSKQGIEGQAKITDIVGGQLNPDWVSWLMGWPIGADSLEPMPDLMWLDWEIDPADMEKPIEYPTAVQYDSTPGGPNNHYKGIGNLAKHGKMKSGAGPIPRVATGIKDRVNRLKALGNGQVPQCMATAWNILTGDWFNAAP